MIASLNKLKSDPTDADLHDFLERIRKTPLTDEAIAELAVILAESGQTLQLGRGRTCDIASTGGPSSLSTLICPLLLKQLGITVPKLGVPGRPAGAIDVLSLINGYEVNLSKIKVQSILDAQGICHFEAEESFAPLDGRLFRLRKEFNMVARADLATASLLSKKLAVGLKHVGLEVRVAKHGNFGDSVEAARLNAARFVHVADMLGIRAVCFLTDAELPYQPFIGRGEALLALYKLFTGQADRWLAQHYSLCWKMVNALANSFFGLVSEYYSAEKLFDIFKSNIESQGGDIGAFTKYAIKVQSDHREEIVAPSDGFISYDLGLIRDAIVNRQLSDSVSKYKYADPCGIILKKIPQSIVSKGDVICSVRGGKMNYKNAHLQDELSAAIIIRQGKSGNGACDLEVVDHG